MTIDGGLRQLFRKHVPQFDWTSIESGATGGGIPDSNFCYQGIEGWIEYKRTSGWTVTLRPEQVGWIARRVRHGGRVWIVTRQTAPLGPRRAARDVLWLIPGVHAVPAKAGGLAAVRELRGVRSWPGGPSSWDWRAVAAVLVA